MGLFDSQLVQNLLDEGELPKVEVETYVSDETIMKLVVAVMFLIIVAVVLARFSKNWA